MTRLHEGAKADLRDAGVPEAAWARANDSPDGTWHGDSCGCPLPDCSGGTHHDPAEACPCLPVLLAGFLRSGSACPPETAALWTGRGRAPEFRRTAATWTRNALIRHGYLKTADLAAATAADLGDIRTFGERCLSEVRRVLAVHGLSLAGEEAQDPDDVEAWLGA